MNNKYFNEWESKQAIKLINTNPETAKVKFEIYLEKYPKDYTTCLFYATTLIKLGLDEKAEKIINNLSKIFYTQKSNYTTPDKLEYFNYCFLFTKFKLLSYQEKYKEIYKLYVDNKELADKINVDRLIFYTRKKLGILKGENRNNYYYFYRQIIEYREDDFLEKLKLHSYNYNNEINDYKESTFDKDFPFDKIIKEIKKYLLVSPSIYNGFVEDTYIFKYDNCGKEKNKAQNYFKVFCFHNTSNIISMYPSSGCEGLPSIDLNYLKSKEINNTKIKKINRIDKFNQRYKK